MKRLYNCIQIKKLEPKDLIGTSIHHSWCDIINKCNSLYTYGYGKHSDSACLIFEDYSGKTNQIDFPKSILQSHFKVDGDGVKDKDGIRLQDFVNMQYKYFS